MRSDANHAEGARFPTPAAHAEELAARLARAGDLRLRDVGEKRLLREFLVPMCRAICGDAGLGDDTAVLRAPHDSDILVSSDRVPTDLLARQFGLMSTEELGRYLVRVNVSDIAAMAGQPLGLVISAAFAPDTLLSDVISLMGGAYSESVAWSCPAVGGDTKSATEQSLSATVLGFVRGGTALKRGPIGIGEQVAVTGPLGTAGAALRWFGQRATRGPSEIIDGPIDALRRAIIAPHPRLDLRTALQSASGRITASMDITDGLGQSLVEIAQPQDLGIEVIEADIPISTAASWVADALDCSPIEFVGGIGNDLELVLVADPDAELPSGAVRIGSVIEEPGVCLRDGDGRRRPFPISGFEHFAKAPAAFLT